VAEFGLPFIVAALGLVGSGGVAWGAVTVVLNSTRTGVAANAAALTAHALVDAANQLAIVDRLARIETRLDTLLKGQQKS
jgi:hypothetical protein